MEPLQQRKRKRRHHSQTHQQQASATPPPVSEADVASKSMRMRKRRRSSHPAVGHGAHEQYTPHVGVDTTNSNWQQLQAALKKGQAGGRPKSVTLNESKSCSGTVREKGGDGVSQRSRHTLSPRNADCSVTKILAMDCEMVGAGLDGKRSILARVSLVNVWGNVVYDKHVKPLEQVTDYRTEVSGVRASNLRKGESFAVVQKEVADLIMGRILVGHSVRNDLKILYLSHPKKDTRDTATYSPLRSLNGRPRALRDITLELLGVQIQVGEHCSVEDARAAMSVYQHLKHDWEMFMSRRGRST